MMKRVRLCLWGVLGLWTWCALADGKELRPNILLCIADDWGWPHAGVYGDLVVQTPTFDRLAREGVLFDHAYVSSPSCTPSRNAVLTGQQFYRLGAGANLRGPLDVRHPNFMFLLRGAGYEIGHWRKAWGPGKSGEGGYTEHPCGPEISFDAFLKNRDKGKPFCFWFGTSDPHRQYERGSGRASGIDVDKVHVPRFLPDTEEIRDDIADYYFEVQRWDRDVGNAVDLLEQRDELGNTMIVMTGDHGMPFPRCKGNLYDWGVQVPLALRWGRLAATNRSISDFVSFTDLAPTFLEAAGLPIPDEMTGRSLFPILNMQDQRRDFVVFGRERHTPAQAKPSLDGYPARAIRTKQWLLILNLKPDRWPAGVPEGSTHRIGRFADCDDGPTKFAIMALQNDLDDARYYDLCFARRGAVELYDCVQDPDQIRNLAEDPDHRDIVQKLRARLINHLTATGDPRFTKPAVDFDAFPYP